LGQITAQYDFTPTSLFVGAKAGAGGDEKTGVISEDSPGVLVDYYEQDYYTDFLKQMRQWYLDGYIYPDAAYTSLSSWELMSEGMILTIPSSSSPGMYTKEVFGEDIVPLRMTEVTYGPASSTGIFWTIPKSSTKAQAAMKFLDLMYSDEEIINLLAWGIEGEHYVVVDAAKGVIDYPDGVDASSVTYLSALGYYGDQTKKYSMDYDSYSEQRMEYISQAKPIGLEYEGFTFDTSEVSVELEQIQEVLDTYEPLLECGCVDYLTTYGSFISRLKAAGIDTVIAEKQRQLDAWLDEQ
jgi:putative aldouronate transport system substrate-binding protein